MSEQKFEKGQLILFRLKSQSYPFSWMVYQFIAENDTKFFLLGATFEKEHAEVIPFEGNEHLLGTFDDVTPKWKPKPDELVAVRDYEEESWKARKFVREACGLFYCLKEKGLETNSWRYCEPLRKHFNVPEE